MNEAENISKRWICGVNNFYSSQLGVIIFILWKLLQWLKRWKSNNFPWNQKCLRSIASISWTHWCGINLIHQISQLCGITYKQAMKPFVSSIFDGTLTFSSELKKYSESSLGGGASSVIVVPSWNQSFKLLEASASPTLFCILYFVFPGVIYCTRVQTPLLYFSSFQLAPRANFLQTPIPKPLFQCFLWSLP